MLHRDNQQLLIFNQFSQNFGLIKKERENYSQRAYKAINVMKFIATGFVCLFSLPFLGFFLPSTAWYDSCLVYLYKANGRQTTILNSFISWWESRLDIEASPKKRSLIKGDANEMQQKFHAKLFN